MMDTKILNVITLGDLIIVAAALVGIIIVSKVLVIYVRRFFKDKVNKEQLNFIIKIVYYGLVLLTLLFVLNAVGVDLSGLLVAGGILGIVLGFASQSIVGNLVSGIFLMVERPVRIGDQVTVDNTSGFVEDISIISTSIRTYDGLYVRIPNEKLFSGKITNLVENIARRIEYRIPISLQDDPQHAIEIIKKVIEAHQYALVSPEPNIFPTGVANGTLELVIRVWAPRSVWYDLLMELLTQIKKALDIGGIRIPLPQQVNWRSEDFYGSAAGNNFNDIEPV